MNQKTCPKKVEIRVSQRGVNPDEPLLRLSWPAIAEHVLESAERIEGPWNAVTLAAEEERRENVVLLPATGAAKFYRTRTQ